MEACKNKGITIEYIDMVKMGVIKGVKEISKSMDCDYKLAYETHCPDFIKSLTTWEEIEPSLKEEDCDGQENEKN